MKKLNAKYKRELRFWTTKWVDTLKETWWSNDIPQLLKIKNNPSLYSYKQRMEHESRGLFLRLLRETKIRNKNFLREQDCY